MVYRQKLFNHSKYEKEWEKNRAEPSDLSWVNNFPQCAQLFSDVGWLTFFKNIEGYHAEVSYKFAQCLDKDIVSFDTLQFKLTKELIAEATGILNEGELWFKKVPFTFNAQKYLLPSVIADWGKVFKSINSNLNGLSPLKSYRVMLLVRVDMLLFSNTTLGFFSILVMSPK